MMSIAVAHLLSLGAFIWFVVHDRRPDPNAHGVPSP
jgi:hypothetical protein